MARRTLNIDPGALLAALTTRDEGLVGTYLDLHTGDLVRLYDPAVVRRTNDVAERQLDAEPERYARVPLYTREYRLMAAFVDSVDDDELARSLDGALAGRSAFRRFDSTLGAWPSERDRWERYRADALRRWAVSWLRSVGVEPAWEAMVPEGGSALPGLLRLLLDGETGPAGRSLHLSSEAEARALFIAVCRELCEIGQEPFHAQQLRQATHFVYAGVEVRHDGASVSVVDRR
jgi:Uncharacterised protein family (UPF0158)